MSMFISRAVEFISCPGFCSKALHFFLGMLIYLQGRYKRSALDRAVREESGMKKNPWSMFGFLSKKKIRTQLYSVYVVAVLLPLTIVGI